jgi:hypothetical protein
MFEKLVFFMRLEKFESAWKIKGIENLDFMRLEKPEIWRCLKKLEIWRYPKNYNLKNEFYFFTKTTIYYLF